MRAVLIYFAILLAISNHVQSARILGLFPHSGRSHQMVFEPFLQKLAERGHHVTSVSLFPLKNPPTNYTDVSLVGITTLGIETVDLNMFETTNKVVKYLGIDMFLAKLFAFWPLDEYALSICRKLVDWPQLTEALKHQYDLVIVEYFNSDCMLGLLHLHGINAPIVAVSSTGIMPWHSVSLGVSDNPAYVPQISLPLKNKMNFWERLENTFFHLVFKYWHRTQIQVKEQEILEKHFGKKIPDLADLSKNVTLMMLNTHHTLNGVRPLIPGLIEVGGMHIDHTRKSIPPYIERFINESEHGVVLFSFGSLIKTATMPKHKEDMIVNALSKLKQRIIWKYENSGEEGTITGNILRVRWIPQYELLQHPKVLAFVAHGGLLGMTEAVSAGKPMVVVPFFGDQPNNAVAAEGAGLATVIPYVDLTEKSLFEAIQKAISAEMRLSAREVSEMWKDRLADPMDTAIYWTERVIRWGKKDPLHSPARDLAFYEKALLDVAAVFILAFVAILLVIKFSFSLLTSFLSSGSKKEKVH